MPNLWPEIDFTPDVNGPQLVFDEARQDLEQLTDGRLTLAVKPLAEPDGITHRGEIFAKRIGYRYPLFHAVAGVTSPYPLAFHTPVFPTSRAVGNPEELRSLLTELFADPKVVGMVKHLRNIAI